MNSFLMTNSPYAEMLIKTLYEKTNLVGIATNKDKKYGRGHKYKKSHIKNISEKYKIQIYQPIFIKKNINFENELKKFNIDLLIVYSYGFILPDSILNISKLDPLNIHTSLLPEYRGASPIQTALLNQNKITGVTIQVMSNKLDEGDIIYQEKTKIFEYDNYKTLEEKLSIIASKSLIKIISLYKENKIKKFKQNNAKASYCKKILKKDGKINWNESYDQINSKIKAYINWPKTYTYYKDKKIIIYKIELISKSKNYNIGKIIKFDSQGIHIQTGDSIINIIELQLENRKILNYKDFVNGNKWDCITSLS